MHIFLTGEIQAGKSTALRRFLAETKIPADGFMTIFDCRGADRELYLTRFDTEISGEAERRLAASFSGGRPEINSEIFDGFGAACLNRAGRRSLILMDELGVMESGAKYFQAAVFRRLDGIMPVVGVIQRRESPFLDTICARADVRLITVTKDNRDTVPGELARWWDGELKIVATLPPM
jgi:nucleoside-triphosphatase